MVNVDLHTHMLRLREPSTGGSGFYVYQTLVKLLAGTFFDFALVRPSRLREHSGQSHIPLALRRSVQPVVRASIRLHSCDPQSNQAARPVWRCEESSHASSSAARVSPISMIFRPIGASLSCEECARCQKRGSCASDSCHKTVVSGKFALNVDARFWCCRGFECPTPVRSSPVFQSASTCECAV